MEQEYLEALLEAVPKAEQPLKKYTADESNIEEWIKDNE